MSKLFETDFLCTQLSLLLVPVLPLPIVLFLLFRLIILVEVACVEVVGSSGKVP